MKRIGVSSLVIALMTLALVQASPGGRQASKKEDKAVLGTWIATEMEIAGMKLPPDSVKAIQLKLTPGRYLVTTAEGKDEGTYQEDASTNPKSLDIMGTDGPNKGKKMLAIYQFEGDNLKVCYDMTGQKRPTAFETTPKSTLLLITYKKEKS